MRFLGKFFPNTYQNSEKGASLLELLVAFFIFSVMSAAIFRGVEFTMSQGQLLRAAPSIYEFDQMVRYEISTMLDHMQRLLIIDEIEQAGTDQEVIYKCTLPQEKLRRAQQNFVFPRMISYGPKNMLAGIQPIASVVDRFDTLAADVRQSNSNSLYKEFAQVLSRCRSSDVYGATDNNIPDATGGYLCGFGHSILVELKFVFWDFLTGESVACSDLNGRPGRGIQAMYRFYHLKPYSDQGKRKFLISRYYSKMFVPKRVNSGMSENRGLWDDP